MERKVGEIFEYNGEWYQCVECDSCGKCSLRTTECGSGTKSDIAYEVFGECSKVKRTDNKRAIFKKLEKVGEPFMCNYYGDSRLIMMQRYKAYNTFTIYPNNALMYVTDKIHGRIAIELKQSKKDMEEKELNLKPFDIEAARQGKPVCTRDGRKARIICFDAKRKDEKNIIALIPSKEYPEFEDLIAYPNNGNYHGGHENDGDLMMLTKKKEGWLNIYKDFEDRICCIYKTKEEALEKKETEDDYITTVKIEWEE